MGEPRILRSHCFWLRTLADVDAILLGHLQEECCDVWCGVGVPVVSAWCWYGAVAGSGVEVVGTGVEVVGACVVGMGPGVAAGVAGGREAAGLPKWGA